MKKILLSFLLILICITSQEKTISKQFILDKNKLFHALVFSIIEYESQFIADTCNKNSDAVGLIQTRCIMVDELNRKFHYRKYKYVDRFNPIKSYQMLLDFQYFFNKERNPEKTARLWHGGINGMYKNSTLSYWNEIKLRLKKRVSNIEYNLYINS